MNIEKVKQNEPKKLKKVLLKKNKKTEKRQRKILEIVNRYFDEYDEVFKALAQSNNKNNL